MNYKHIGIGFLIILISIFVGFISSIIYALFTQGECVIQLQSFGNCIISDSANYFGFGVFIMNMIVQMLIYSQSNEENKNKENQEAYELEKYCEDFRQFERDNSRWF